MKIGDEVWTIEPRDRRKGWERYTITGETRASWLVKVNNWSERKFSKTTMLENHGPQWGHQRWYSAEDKVARESLDRHASEISKRVSELASYDPEGLVARFEKLKKIAEILGMDLKCNPPS